MASPALPESRTPVLPWERLESVVQRDHPELDESTRGQVVVQLVQDATAANLSLSALVRLLEAGFAIGEVVERLRDALAYRQHAHPATLESVREQLPHEPPATQGCVAAALQSLAISLDEAAQSGQ